MLLRGEGRKPRPTGGRRPRTLGVVCHGTDGTGSTCPSELVAFSACVPPATMTLSPALHDGLEEARCLGFRAPRPTSSSRVFADDTNFPLVTGHCLRLTSGMTACQLLGPSRRMARGEKPRVGRPSRFRARRVPDRRARAWIAGDADGSAQGADLQEWSCTDVPEPPQAGLPNWICRFDPGRPLQARWARGFLAPAALVLAAGLAHPERSRRSTCRGRAVHGQLRGSVPIVNVPLQEITTYAATTRRW